MYVLITYDVNTSTPEGRKRLTKVAKCCTDFGQRVQNSVFECLVDNATFLLLKKRLLSIIDNKLDSVRIYRLGNGYQSKIEKYGKSTSYEFEGELII